MGDLNEQTIVISDLLSFLSCNIKLVPKEKLLKVLQDYYLEKDIKEGHKTLLASLPVKKSTRHGRRVKNPDPLLAIYECFMLIQSEDLPIFVCKNLNNVPDVDIVKAEPMDVDDLANALSETEDLEMEQSFAEEQKCLKSQISDIATLINKLRDELNSVSDYTSKEKAFPQSRQKRKKLDITDLKKQTDSKNGSNVKEIQGFDKREARLSYLQSLIDEDEGKSDGEESALEYDINQDSHYAAQELEEFDEEADSDTEYLLNKIGDKELEGRISISEDTPTMSKSSRNSYRRGNAVAESGDQKVIFIKTEENENSIEITSSSDYFRGFDVDDASNMIGNLDSIITISKNDTPEAINIEKVAAANGEGFYYKCQRCEFICNEEKMILKHECNSITVQSKNRNPSNKNKSFLTSWHCSICSIFIEDLVKFNEHMLDHCKITREKGVFECVLCTFKTYQPNTYYSHLVEHSWKTPYTCDLCDYKSTKEVRMKNHALKHLECKGPNHFECLICQKICGTRNALEKHKQRHKKNYDFQCNFCGLTFRHRSALSQHTANHTKERAYVCHVCGYRYESRHSLDVHIKVHFRDDLFPCHICDRKFKSKNTFRNHVLTVHDGIKSFKCDLCNESFVFRHTMLIHRKTHGNQLYVCGYCNKKFKSQHYLKIHCAVHEGKTPFKCSSCDFATSSKAVLKKHMNVHANTEALKEITQHADSDVLSLMYCDQCAFATMSPIELEKHFNLDHSNILQENKMMIIMEET